MKPRPNALRSRLLVILLPVIALALVGCSKPRPRAFDLRIDAGDLVGVRVDIAAYSDEGNLFLKRDDENYWKDAATESQDDRIVSRKFDKNVTLRRSDDLANFWKTVRDGRYQYIAVRAADLATNRYWKSEKYSIMSDERVKGYKAIEITLPWEGGAVEIMAVKSLEQR